VLEAGRLAPSASNRQEWRFIIVRDTGKLDEITKTKEIGGLKLVTQEFEPLDVDRMIKTASELIRKDSTMVVVFYGKDQKPHESS
jgi:nitroreductase